MSRNNSAIELICREELRAMSDDPDPAVVATKKALKRILKNIRNGEDISDEDWDLYESIRAGFVDFLMEP